MSKQLTRKDRCHLVGKRAGILTGDQARSAWFYLSGWVESMGKEEQMALPKFQQLLRGIRCATIFSKKGKILTERGWI